MTFLLSLILFILKSSISSISEAPNNEIKDIILKYHNEYRKVHCAPPLIWGDRMSKKAKEFADKLVSSNNVRYNQRFGFGENIFLRYEANPTPFSTKLNFTNVTAQWYKEIDNYDFETGRNAKGKEGIAFGHLTAILWYSTQRVGCGVAVSKWEDEKYFKAISSLVCNYWPSGNIEGAFLKNVFQNRNMFKDDKCPNVTSENPFGDYSNFEEKLSYGFSPSINSELNYSHPPFWIKSPGKVSKEVEALSSTSTTPQTTIRPLKTYPEQELEESSGNYMLYSHYFIFNFVLCSLFI